MTKHAEINVLLGGRSYPIVIKRGCLTDIGGAIADGVLSDGSVPIVADTNTHRLFRQTVEKELFHWGFGAKWFVLEPGESAKSWKALEDLTDWMLSLGVKRSSIVIGLGGGVVGDLTGFACSMVKRGCRFVQLPTTLLSQVDSSVGGKTAINTTAGKNLIGAFHQPCEVLIDPLVLDTLPDREMRAGYAEIIKYGLLGDAEFFAWLEQNGGRVLAREPEALTHAIATSIRAKARIVAEDEREICTKKFQV